MAKTAWDAFCGAYKVDPAWEGPPLEGIGRRAAPAGPPAGGSEPRHGKPRQERRVALAGKDGARMGKNSGVTPPGRAKRQVLWPNGRRPAASEARLDGRSPLAGYAYAVELTPAELSGPTYIFLARGKTYEHRGTFRAAGWRWNPERRAWLLEGASEWEDPAVEAAVALSGVEVERIRA